MIKTIKELGHCLQKKIINSEFKNLKYYKSIINNYNGEDWRNHIVVNSEFYHKEKVFECNEFDMYIITWDKLQKSKIHNHAKLGCLNKVLKGSLQEFIYNSNCLQNPVLTRINNCNMVTYIDNSIGYHRIENNNNHISVSLHIYSPPKFKTKYLN